MFRNYLKTAWRNLVNQKLFSVINITGLALGLAVCMLILLYVEHEKSYDDFHVNAKKIAWVHALAEFNGDSIGMERMSGSTASLARQYLPEVVATVRLSPEENPAAVLHAATRPDERYAEKKFLFADSNFFDVFSFPLLQMSTAQVLKNPFTVVITPGMAKKYFGDANPLGQQIVLNGQYRFTVTGIVAPAPSNSSVVFDFVASLSSLGKMKEKQWQLEGDRFGGGSFVTYFLLSGELKPAALEKRLAALQVRADPQNKSPDRFIATPLTACHLSGDNRNDANLKYLSLFPLVAGLVLLLALTNYISLSTARAGLRAKEIGIRKVMGANRLSVGFQFFLESALYTSVAFAIAYVLCSAGHAAFFRYLQLPVDHRFLYSARLLSSFFVLYVATVALASIYPSMLLSAFRPALVLYGRLNRQSGGLSLRKFITVFQFSISVSLMIAGIGIYRQVRFFRNTSTGVDRENVLMIPFPASMGKHFPALRSGIAAISGVQQVAVNHYEMYSGYDMWAVASKENTKGVFLSAFNVDRNFIRLLHLQWAALPDDPDFGATGDPIILNETAVEKLHLKPGILHQQVILPGGNKKDLAGILKDFNFESLQNKIDPMALLVAPDTAALWSSINGSLMARINPRTNLPQLLAKMKTVYEKLDATTPFSYRFLDEAFDSLYRAEERLAQIFLIFVVLTIGIAALGLFGLVTFITSQRTKEIGIRKVLGASVPEIFRLITKDFVILVGIAWVVSCPVAGYFLHRWLEGFAYRIHLEWWMLASGGVAAMLVAFATIGFQSVRAATVNPINSLRTD